MWRSWTCRQILNVNEGAQKGILEGILCVFMISGDAVRIPDKPSRVRLAQCGEGFRLPLLCCRYQGVFAHCRLPRDCIAMMKCSVLRTNLNGVLFRYSIAVGCITSLEGDENNSSGAMSDIGRICPRQSTIILL